MWASGLRARLRSIESTDKPPKTTPNLPNLSWNLRIYSSHINMAAALSCQFPPKDARPKCMVVLGRSRALLPVDF